MFESDTRPVPGAPTSTSVGVSVAERRDEAADVLPSRALVVEDSTPILQLINVLLTRCGVQHVMNARCGSEAVDVLRGRQERTDCVISDVIMPSGSGLHLLQTIRTGQLRGVRADMCVILISGGWTPETLQYARELDVSGVLAKPFTYDRLRTALIAARKRVFPLDIARYRAVELPIQWYLPLALDRPIGIG